MTLEQKPRAAELTSYTVKRLLGAVFVVWAAVTLAFFAVKLIPGNPVDIMIGPLAQVSDATRAQIAADLGLNEPLANQYLNYLGGLLRGDLGTSYQLNQPVSEVLGAALVPTAQLALGAILCSLLFVALAILASRNSFALSAVSGAQVLAATIPVFWLGYVLMYLFSFQLGWFPAISGSGITSLVLPSLTLGVAVAAVLGQIVLGEIGQTQRSSFAVSVRARGVSGLRFDLRHGLKHATGATLPLTAQILGSLFGGAVLVEQVFARPGLGSQTLLAITNRDMPVILGVVALSALIFALFGLIADLGIWLVDPRVRAASRHE